RTRVEYTDTLAISRLRAHHRHLPDLHAIPPRRSSDLWQTTSRWGPISAAHHAMPFCLYLRNGGPINNPSWRIGFAFHWSDGANRSEEHTSELQSRENHVCRLLLEKKKHESSFLPFNS